MNHENCEIRGNVPVEECAIVRTARAKCQKVLDQGSIMRMGLGQ